MRRILRSGGDDLSPLLHILGVSSSHCQTFGNDVGGQSHSFDDLDAEEIEPEAEETAGGGTKGESALAYGRLIGS